MQVSFISSGMSVIRAIGSLNADSAVDFEHRLLAAIAGDPSLQIVIDLSGVVDIDRSGLMALVAALRMARCSNRRLLFSPVPTSLQMVFELTQLDRVCEFVDASPVLVPVAA
jgi:anti-sigma B factor antagonist